MMSRSDYFLNLIFSLMQLWCLSSVRVGCQFFYSRNGNRLHVGETRDPDDVDVIFPHLDQAESGFTDAE